MKEEYAALNSSSQHHKHLPALDGVRGIAVLMVLVHHLTVTKPHGKIDFLLHMPGNAGWMGVDLFFVLSGFLITGILYDAKNSIHYFRNFYARRSLRIFPLYYAFLAIILIVLPRLLSPGAELVRHLPAHPQLYLLYLSNFSLVFLDQPHNIPMSATWSLAIEEQFYIVWPAVVLLCSRRALQWICGGVVLAAIVCRIAMVHHGYGWLPLYYLTPCRMDGLAIGAFCAVGIRGPSGVSAFRRCYRWIPQLAIAGFLAVVIQQRSLHWEGGLGQTVGYSIVGILFAWFLISAIGAKDNHWLYRALTTRSLTFFGRYSYAIYLVHLPICILVQKYVYRPVQFLTLGGSQWPGQIIFYFLCVSITISVALFSWNVFEKPILTLKRFFSRDDTNRRGKLLAQILIDKIMKVPPAGVLRYVSPELIPPALINSSVEQ